MTKSLLAVTLATVTLTAAPAFAQQHRRGSSAGHDHGVYVAPHGHAVYAAPHYYYARPYYAHPYYAFRPHFSIGFGVSVGYPVAYPVYSPYYAAPYPYGYPAPPPYTSGYPAPYPSQPYPPNYPSQGYPSQDYPSQGYPSQGYPSQGYPSQGYPSQGYPQGGSYPSQYPSQSSPSYGNNSVQAQRGTSSYGNAGVSFEISPSDAAVFVDGTYVGTVDQFGPQNEPLKLTAGRHRIELRASGMQPMSFDATIVAGQVIPYRGTLQPQ